MLSRRCTSLMVLAVALLATIGLGNVAYAQQNCANAAIRAPFSGDTLQGRVPILGSARIDDFNFYKVEWAPAEDPENWRAVSETINEHVLNGLLDEWDTTTVPDGIYRLKLTVVDGLHQEVCRISVSGLVVANYSTPTPEASPTEDEEATAVPQAGPDEVETDAQAGPTPTLEPIVPVGEETTSGDVLDPSTWLELFQIGSWIAAFLRGFIAGSVLGIALLSVWFVRSQR